MKQTNRAMKELGIGNALVVRSEDLLKSLRSGKPIKQTVVRKMRVKGKTFYAHESFVAPFKP